MNRRRFLELLGVGIGSSAIVYSFPSVIVPKNIVIPPPSIRILDVKALSAAQRAYIVEAVIHAYKQEVRARRSLFDEIRSNHRGRRVLYNWTNSI